LILSAGSRSIEIKVLALSRQKTARQGRGTQIESDLPRNYKGTRRPGHPRPGGRAVLAKVAAQSAAGRTRAVRPYVRLSRLMFLPVRFGNGAEKIELHIAQRYAEMSLSVLKFLLRPSQNFGNPQVLRSNRIGRRGWSRNGPQLDCRKLLSFCTGETGGSSVF